MHVEEGRHAEAQALITELKAQSDGLDVASVEALSLDMQGKGEEARGVYRKLIASPENAVSVTASIILANYMAARGDVEGAVKVLEDARAKQDPKVANVDRAMAQFYDGLGQKEKAIEAARRVIAATGDADGNLRKEIVRTYLRLGKFDEADQEYAGLASLESKDVDVLLLKADTKLARKDETTARAILDDAVARFSQIERPCPSSAASPARQTIHAVQVCGSNAVGVVGRLLDCVDPATTTRPCASIATALGST